MNAGRMRRIAPLLGAALLLLACGPAAPTQSSVGDGTASQLAGQPASQPASPKMMTMSLKADPVNITTYGRPLDTGLPEQERWTIFHANLTQFDLTDSLFPVLAQKVPAIPDGDWKVNPDGSMEVTWKLKPGAIWQDGTPLSAEDFVFGFQVVTDPRLKISGLGQIIKIAGVRAPDAQTLVVSWRETSVWGSTNGNDGFPALPRHILEGFYRSGDLPALDNSPYWRDQWVGLGPYKLTTWEGASYLQADAFDQYVLGRPKIDRLLLRVITDPNVVVAQVEAGAIDVVTQATSLKPEQIVEIRRAWVAEGKGTAEPRSLSTRVVTFNFADPTAPWARDPRFRQAIIYGMNRDQDLVEALQFGLTAVAPYFVSPRDPVYAMAQQRGVMQYPYDPAQSQRLFAAAGWTKAADGTLRNSAGESIPFRCCRTTAVDSNGLRESLAIVSILQGMGIQAVHPLPSPPGGLSNIEQRQFLSVNNDGQVIPLRPGLGLTGGLGSLMSENIPRAENGFVGSNSGNWSNPAYDALAARAEVTLDPAQRQAVRLQQVQLLVQELPIIPMYYSPEAVVVKNGIEGPGEAPALAAAITWNIQTWDVK